MRSLTITGLLALAVGSVSAVAAAQDTGKRAPFWPATSGPPVVKEWYSDIPWHQKLGTYAGNEIDEALVLPYDALGTKAKAYCTNHKLGQEECMLELGINNILGTLRTDRLYAPQDQKIKAAPECQDPALPCMEVMLELSSFWTRSNGSDVALEQRPLGHEPAPDGHYGGYVITDGSSYAPQMPWYMAHYCDSLFPQGVNDVQDPVCYGDYLSPMNSGFNAQGKAATDWPRSVPWSVFPSTASGPGNHCREGETKCTLAMAGFDLGEVPPNPENLQYGKYNENLLAWFNAALKSFPNDVGQAELQHHFPWSGAEIAWETFLYPQAVLNPFLGQYAYRQTAPPNGPGCDVTVNGPATTNCFNTAINVGDVYLYPRKCTLGDLAGANVARLRQCGLNYELHHNGYYSQWPESFWPDVKAANMIANQYGRTSFMFAGVPGLQLPVPFYKVPGSDSGLSIYEQVYNASIFSLYLPMANVADVTHAFTSPQLHRQGVLPYVAHEQPHGGGSVAVRGRHQREGAVAQRIPDAADVRRVRRWQVREVRPQDVRGGLRPRDGPGALSQPYLRRVPRAQRQRRADQHRGQARRGAPGIHDGREVQALSCRKRTTPSPGRSCP